jgi:sec-independent protein translocase protein TatA
MFENLFRPMHLLVIVFIALLVFGPKKLPELGKGLGEGLRSFKESMNGKDAPTKTEEEKKSLIASISDAVETVRALRYVT